MKKQSGAILIVDDDEDVLQAASLFLKQHVETVRCERDPEQIPHLLRSAPPDIILLDMNFTRDVSSGREGLLWLSRILETDREAVVVLITAYGDVDLAVRAIKQGASDFVLKPWQNEKLLATVSAALELRRSRGEAARLRSRREQLSADLDHPYHDFIGASGGMREVLQTVDKVADTDANVLIMGENGTGKELVARALHRRSSRSAEIFLSVDMGAISETLFESELFGHVRGAFTDARSDRVGRIELASGGTLFLDEIGNLPLALQAKLLRVLECREVTRLGANRSGAVDIRLICASNMPLPDMARERTFRQDLLYRINTVEIRLPPLRERHGDIPLLAEHFLGLYCRKYKKGAKRISAAALKKLESYPWPGNIRELRHAIERVVIMNDDPVLEPGHFPLTAPSEAPPDGGPGNFTIEQVEAAVIRRALARHNGNISHAARELGLTRAALYRRLEKHHI